MTSRRSLANDSQVGLIPKIKKKRNKIAAIRKYVYDFVVNCAKWDNSDKIIPAADSRDRHASISILVDLINMQN